MGGNNVKNDQHNAISVGGFIEKMIVKIRLDCMIEMICCFFCIGFYSGYSICNKNFHEKEIKVFGSVLGTT